MSTRDCPECQRPMDGQYCSHCGWPHAATTQRIGTQPLAPRRSRWPLVLGLLGLAIIGLLVANLLKPNPAPTQVVVVQSPTPAATSEAAQEPTAVVPAVEPTAAATVAQEPTSQEEPTASPMSEPVVVDQFAADGSVVEMQLQAADIARFPAGYAIVGQELDINGVRLSSGGDTIGLVVILEEGADVTTPRILYEGKYANVDDNFVRVTHGLADIMTGRSQGEKCFGQGCAALPKVCNGQTCDSVQIIYWPSRQQEIIRR